MSMVGGIPSQTQTHSMYGIYTYIQVVWGVNVGIYGIHGVFGKACSPSNMPYSGRFGPLGCGSKSGQGKAFNIG